jgi:hypothetical protein
MPKTNDATGATYAGYEGVVEHAGGRGASSRPGGLSQLDPSREVDGKLTEGFESDERDISDREDAVTGADFAEVHPVQDGDREVESGGDESSDGDSSSESSESDSSSQTKPAGKTPSSARKTGSRS